MEFRLLCSPSKFTNEWKERQWKSMERVTKKCIYIERERAKEGGLTRHHPQTIKYQLGSCLPAKFISVRGASLLIIRWPISFRETNILRCRMQSLRESLKPLRSRFRSLEIVAFPLLLLLPLLRSLRSLLASTKINSEDLSVSFLSVSKQPFRCLFFSGFLR